MATPGLAEPIVAISSAWQPAPRGIVRTSGSDLRPQLDALQLSLADLDTPHHGTSPLALEGIRLPCTYFWFPSGRSYTGQQLLEVHTSGSLPWLRCVAGALLAAGARAAGPGEFTARALLNGRLDGQQAEGVLGLIHARDAASARLAARACLGQGGQQLEDISQALLSLVGAIEAGIDFVEEEDIAFIDSATLRTRLEDLLGQLAPRETQVAWSRPHVALLGPPNAGKSTLFNALLGTERAIVSPVLGTTRDVLSAELELDGQRIVLQDTAGLGEAVDALDAAAQSSSRMLLEQADAILWVSDGRQDPPGLPEGWGEASVIVRTHADQPGHGGGGLAFDGVSGEGLEAIRAAIGTLLGQVNRGGISGPDLSQVRPHVERALQALGPATSGNVRDPELIALELRAGWEHLRGFSEGPITEQALGWIYQNFCLGK